MAQDPVIREVVQVGQTPGSGNGVVPAQPGTPAAIVASLLRQYVAGGVGGSGQWFANVPTTLPWAIDDVARDFGADIYRRMLLDPQVSSAVRILKSSVLEDGVVLTSPIEDEDADGYALAREIRDAAERMLDDLATPLDDVLLDLLDAIAVGSRVAEQEFALERARGGQPRLTLVGLHVRPQESVAFVVDAYLRVIGLLARIPGQGAPVQQSLVIDPANTPNLLPREKFAILTWRPRDNDPRGTSDLRPAYTAWNFKRQVLIEYMRYLAQFASPGLIGITGEHAQTTADPATGQEVTPEQVMLAALLGYKNGTAAAVPFGSSVQIVESNGEGRAFEVALDFFDRQITKSILGQTLASEEGKHQARAASLVHQDILDTIVRQAKKAVARMLTRQVLRPWVRWNWGEAAAAALTPHVSLGTAEQPDIVGLWTAAAALYTSGYVTPSQKPDLDQQLNLTPSLPEEVAALTRQLANASQPPAPAPAGPGDDQGAGGDAAAD